MKLALYAEWFSVAVYLSYPHPVLAWPPRVHPPQWASTMLCSKDRSLASSASQNPKLSWILPSRPPQLIQLLLVFLLPSCRARLCPRGRAEQELGSAVTQPVATLSLLKPKASRNLSRCLREALNLFSEGMKCISRWEVSCRTGHQEV